MTKDLNNVMRTPLSPDEVRNIYSRASKGKTIEIKMYDDIIKYPTIDHMFNGSNMFILFYPLYEENSTTSGHYCCLIKKNKTIYFYDPYGGKPDAIKKFTPQREELYRESNNSLIRKILESGYKCDYSNFRHQNIRDLSIATCGRHCIMRCLFSNQSNAQYNKRIKHLMRLTHCSNLDEFVSYITINV